MKIITLLAAVALIWLWAPALTAQSGEAEEQPVEADAPAEDFAPDNPSGPRLTMESMTFEAGKIPAGSTLSHSFSIRNDGDQPLIIEQVRPGCGCTVAEFERELAPGESGVIDVSMEIYEQWAGSQLRKTVWVISNDPLHRQVRLIISGEVTALQEAQNAPETK